MNIGIIGATGKAGDFILKEAKDRGYDVTAIVRNPSKLEHNVNTLEHDIFTLTRDDLSSFDVVLNAFGTAPDQEQPHIDAGRVLSDALQGTKTRLFIVGGAASLYVDDDKTTQLIDTPDFPDEIKPMARGQVKNLDALQNTSNLTWTFLSPAVEFDPAGTRTGSYQKGNDHLFTNADGDSYISYADYAIAVVDEIENKQHINERFTVVGERN
ncbi:NAD(P)-dependent oxidoreductase [Salibacterium salarium]|uniref:NAD(P)-dependent oxidoreductase n=1 Tax=Salibacterium salarium TaxID=284579 RepID=A0A3R9QTJ2_9BACI|nr:NAD(P)-dependent oxidoreductase [Salibacterium salarium]RSL33110.1 NAD(P)-dependent oxidoreductase [Salibacterium salarium]